MKKSTVFLFLLIMGGRAGAAGNYYIDCVGGLDTNTGTSTSTPWQHAPGMQNFTGTYTPSTGDQILFKGGASCPNSFFPYVISNSGAAPTNMTYYGVDKSFFTGGSWTQPIFDMGNSVVTSTNVAIIISTGVVFVEVDNIEIKNLFWTGTAQAGAIFVSSNTDQVVLKNLFIHAWTHDPTSTNGTQDVFHAVETQEPSVTGLYNSTITDVDGDGASGVGAFNVSNVSTCTIHDLSSAWVSSNTVVELSYSHLYNINPSFDGVSTSRAIQTSGVSLIFSNYISSFSAATAGIITQPSHNTGIGDDEIYNNVVWNTGSKTPFLMDTGGPNASTANPLFVNNTIVPDAGNYCLAVGNNSSAGSIGNLTLVNNHCISDVSAVTHGLCTNTGSCASISVSSTIADNLVMSHAVAATDNYTLGNFFAPTASTSPTVGQGMFEAQVTQDILGNPRSQDPNHPSLDYDIGAYELPRAIASFTRTPSSGGAPLTVNFDASNSTNAYNTAIVGYSWAFGDGQQALGLTSPTTSHIYLTAGTYVSTLTVTTSGGLTGSTSLTTVASQINTATLTLSTAATIGGSNVDLDVTFTPSPDKGAGDLQFDLTLPATVTYDSTTVGPAATAAGKAIAENPAIPRILISGLNSTPIGAGVVAIVHLTTVAGIPVGVIPIPMINLQGASTDFSPVSIPVNGANGSIDVTASAPDITSTGTLSGTLGTPITPYPIKAINTPTSFSATGLPSGLAVNATTGLISGTPTQAGTFTVTLSATNAVGTGQGTISAVIGVSGAGTVFSPRAYPSPWRSDRNSGLPITFDQLSGNTTIKIFTASARRVLTLSTGNASITWDLTNESGDKVASGLYFYVITNDQGQKAEGKFVIIK